MPPARAATAVFVHLAGPPPGSTSGCVLPADYESVLVWLTDRLTDRRWQVLSYSLLPRQWQLVVGPIVPLRAGMGRRRVSPAPSATPLSFMRLLTGRDLVRTCRLVERLPLELGLVRRAQDWPWSSLGARLRPHHPLPMASAPFLASRAWVDYVNLRVDAPDSLDVAEAPGRLP